MREVQIGNRMVGDDHPVYVVAEIGINHNGDVSVAKRLIDAAVAAGCNAVKFQKRDIDVVYTAEELERPRENPFGPTNGDLKRGLEFGNEEYQEIDSYCKQHGIEWFASCWDEGSVDFIDQFEPPCYKIASASLTDTRLLEHTVSKGRPIILSTGMSTEKEIDRAITILSDGVGLVVLHTISTYPAKNDELNLGAIRTLRERYWNLPVGYSGHEVGLAPSLMAAVLGACMIERHVTLDRSMFGTDQSASIEPQGLTRLVRDIRMWETVRGDGKIRLYESEIPVKEKLRRK
ncbi:N-acetylneuraminate synthase [bacterium]|nr:N-acetylneuraminate synthase [bacterium]